MPAANTSSTAKIDTLCINTIRLLAIDGVQKANSGHPGLPLGAAPMAYVLWQHFLRHHPGKPLWPNRDRFVLSAGHGSMLLYTLMHLTGYDLSLDDLQNFRQWHSRTPGHPENFMTQGVEATTGPLGQGAGNAVGMAIAERMLARMYNRPGFSLVDHRTYALVSDGDMMEGIAAEAASLAGHLKLGKLTYLYDANQVCLDGPTSLCFSEDVGQRFAAYGWQVLHVEDGDHDVAGLQQALQSAQDDTQRPTLIVVRTTLGFGSPNKQGTSASHGSPLGAAEVKLVKSAFGFDPEASFAVPAAAGEHLRGALSRGATLESTWQKLFDAYAQAFPQLAKTWEQAHQHTLNSNWTANFPTFKVGEALASREASGKVLNAVATSVPYFVGGDADLSISTLTSIKSSDAFTAHAAPTTEKIDQPNGQGRNIHFGVREHAMGAIANGIAFHRGLHPCVATFFVFSDYMRPSVRLAALCKLAVTYVWTHDSIGLGEDGPTHQPVEHLMALRAMPNLYVMRPADAQETAACWRVAMTHTQGPVALALSRQKLPTLDLAALHCPTAQVEVDKGAYILAEAANGKPQALLLATGSEVHIALAAQKLLLAQGHHVRVVSMPCWELFAAQTPAYRDKVLPPQLQARLSIEAGVTFGWERFVGPHGESLGLDTFGHSAPAEVIYEQVGLTAQHAASRLAALLQKKL